MSGETAPTDEALPSPKTPQSATPAHLQLLLDGLAQLKKLRSDEAAYYATATSAGSTSTTTRGGYVPLSRRERFVMGRPRAAPDLSTRQGRRRAERNARKGGHA